MRFHVLACAMLTYASSMVGYNSTGDEFQNQEGDAWSPEVIKIYDESEVQELEDAGVQILRRRGDILLCYVPNTSDEPTTRRAASEQPKLPRRNWNIPTLDNAVKWYGANRIFTGEGFDKGYTGQGVVIGLCDIGLDPTHPTFLDAEGRSRIAQITQYKEAEGTRIHLSGDDAYIDWVTDDADNYHATHVAGILAGNGRFWQNGERYPAGNISGDVSDLVTSQYVGVARDAEIVASVSQLSDVGLLCGVEDIIDYAKNVGKPVVINLSMGNYVGAHDGTSLFTQYLDMCAEDAIIVLSAGNEGNSTCSLSYTFKSDDGTVGFRIGNTAWDQKHIYGMTDIWSEDERPLSIALGVYDDQTRQVTPLMEMAMPEPGEVVYITSDDSETLFSDYFEGWLAFGGEINIENGRYNLQVLYDYNAEKLVSGGWARYTMAVTLAPSGTGQSVDIYADGQFTRLMGMSGSPAPSSEFSISDLACGYNVISVGMYVNDAITMDNGEEGHYVSDNSSYGILRDGRVMPMTVAPGEILVSSCSRPYAAKNLDSWDGIITPYVGAGGTSMAAPYLAGFVATMLEAFPELTVAQVQEAVKATNHVDDLWDPENPRNGDGFFDPYEAMMYLFDKASVNGTTTDDSRVRILVRDGVVEVLNPTTADVPVEVYSATGVFVNRLEAAPGVTALQLPKGLWVIRAAYSSQLILL